MRLFCDTLTATLERQLQKIELAALDPLCSAKEAMKFSPGFVPSLAIVVQCIPCDEFE